MTKSTSVKVKQQGSNGWDFLRDFMDHLYNLLSLEKIGAATFFVLSIVLIVLIVKFPEDDLPEFINRIYGDFIQLTGPSGLLVLILFILLTISIIGNIVGNKVYRREIKRLVGKRKQLIHGRRSGIMVTIKDHNGSGLDV